MITLALAAKTFAFIAAGGAINRLRGWSGGWEGKKQPWLVWIQANIFTREILAVLEGLTVFGYLHSLGVSESLSAAISVPMAGAWLFGVIFGWGDYFDDDTIPNHEIAWIDDFVKIVVQPVLTKYFSKTGLATNPWFIDSFSFGLRDTYYLPMMAVIPVAMHSWLAAIPAALFWIDAITYSGFHYFSTPGADYVRKAEIAGGAIRHTLTAAAVLLALA